MVTYTRRITTQFEASRATLLKFLQEEPGQYLDLINVQVEKELSRKPEAGEWEVVEKLTIPFVPETKFKTRFDRLEDGCRWQSWVDNGIYVDSVLTIDGFDDNTTDRKGEICSATEIATIQCPFYLYPIVRSVFIKNHNANLIKLQHHIKSKQASSSTSSS